MTLKSFNSDLHAERAMADLVAWLKNTVLNNSPSVLRDHEPYVFNILQDYIRPRLHREPVRMGDRDASEMKIPLMNAIWSLCSRGILRPGTVEYGRMDFNRDNTFFALTNYGERWLRETDLDNAIPLELSRCSTILASYRSLFGRAFDVRAQEAVRCYEAHVYFACCAMCGAASESILLALAGARIGADKASHEYSQRHGRDKLSKALAGRMRPEQQLTFDSYLEQVSYWRDESAHGAAETVGEELAFTSLILLLRFARFADTKWQDLTGMPHPNTNHG